MNRLRAFALLAAEAAREPLRRRFAFAVALVLLFGLVTANTCTGLGANVTLGGERLDPAVAGGFVAPVLFANQALLLLVLAAVLAADHLARPLADGTAALWLARPVARTTFAGARLAGALAVIAGAGLLLLGPTTALLVSRHGVPVGPALAAGGATLLAAVVVAALAMALSLAVGRTLALNALVLSVPLQALANGLAFVTALVHPGAELPGVLGALDRYGPPLGTALYAAIGAWNPYVDVAGLLAPALGRLALWAAGTTALLLWAFHRVEIEPR